MNKITTQLLILVIIVSGFTPLNAQKSKKKDEQFREMKALIEIGFYEFKVQSVQPTGARTISTTSNYSLEARDSIYSAYLPYFGRVYQPRIGGSGGIKFKARPENLEISLNEKKRTVNVKFQIKGEYEKYDIYLTAGSSGYGTLSIVSPNRQSISYSGVISPLTNE